MKFSKIAMTFGLVSALAAGNVQADEKGTAFPMFIGKDTVSQITKASASDNVEFSYGGGFGVPTFPSSWTVTSQVSRQVCVQWEGGQIFKQPDVLEAAVERGDDIEYPGRRCIRWETVYSTVNHGTATRYHARNLNMDNQVVVLQPYYFSLDGSELSSSDFYDLINVNSLAYRLRSAGYSVVLYQYKDMNAGIQAAATGARALIKELSDNSSVDSISVIGLSMGGVVGRYALTQMAYQGVDSKVTNFISYDAPHTGANIPKSVIDNVKRLEDKIDVPFCGEVSFCSQERRKLRALLAQMNTKTFKQLVIDAPNAGTERTSLINQINAWGGRPSVPSLAISNGTSGAKPGVPHNKLVTHFKLYRHWLVGGSKYFEVRTNAAKDNVNGGMLDFYTSFSTAIANMDHPITAYVTLPQEHTFVPTSSAIAGSTSRWNRVVYSPTNETHMMVTSSKANEVYNWVTTYNN